jgi:hypothetical protein
MFTITSKINLECSTIWNTITKNLGSIFEINSVFPNIELDYIYNPGVTNSELILNAFEVFIFKNSYVNLAQKRKRDYFYLAFDFTKIKDLPDNDAEYALSIKAYNRELADVNGDFEKMKSYNLADMNIPSIKNIEFGFISKNNFDTSFVPSIFFSDVVLNLNKVSSQVIIEGYKDPLTAVYQLALYQDPAGSDFLYNRSPFIFAPSLNGDPSTRRHQMHSFYSPELEETFWIGIPLKGANYILLPDRIISSIDQQYVEIHQRVGFTIMTDGSIVDDNIGFPVLTIEDAQGNVIIEIIIILKTPPPTTSKSYMFFIEVKYLGNSKISEGYIIIDYEKINYYFFRLQISVNEEGNCIFDMKGDHQNTYNYNWGKFATTHSMKDFHRVYLGAKNAPFSSAPLIFLFQNLNIFQGAFTQNERAATYFAFYKGDYLPYRNKFYSNFTKPLLWLPPQEPKMREVYLNQLKNSGPAGMSFQTLGCPDNCEICDMPWFCSVCVTGFALNTDSLCEAHVNADPIGIYFNDARANIKGSASGRQVTVNSNTSFFPNGPGYEYMLIDFHYDIGLDAAAPANAMACEMKLGSTNEVLDQHLLWKYANRDIKPYLEFEQSEGNFHSQIFSKTFPKPTYISTNHCKLKVIAGTQFTPDCAQISDSASLRGSLNLHFCQSVFLDITYSKNMIRPSTGVPVTGEYYQIPLPGTSIILYGECTNNCKCWNGDLNTTEGYSKCYPNPKYSYAKCAPYYKHVTWGDSLEECVRDWTCNENCLECDPPDLCTKCVDDKFHVNFISHFNNYFYCDSCVSNCLSCSGGSAAECRCWDYQFGDPGSTYFDSKFRLCLPTFVCPEKCLKCVSSSSCEVCYNNYIFNFETLKCEEIISNKCAIHKTNNRELCLECYESTYLTKDNECKRCSPNCLECENESNCLVCKDKFKLNNGYCFHYTPFLGRFIGRDFNNFSKEEFPENFELLEYNIEFILKNDISLLFFEKFDILRNSNLSFILKEDYVNLLRRNSHRHCLQNNKQPKCLFLRKFPIVLEKRKYKTNFNINSSLDSNCIKQKRKGICTLCSKNFYLDSIKNKCFRIDNYNIFSMKLNKIQQMYFPKKCSKNFYINPKTQKCKPQIQNCKIMLKKQTCSKCEPEYFLSPNKRSCTKCSNNCTRCLDSTFCLDCTKGYYLSSRQGKINFLINKKITSTKSAYPVNPHALIVCQVNSASNALRNTALKK